LRSSFFIRKHNADRLAAAEITAARANFRFSYKPFLEQVMHARRPFPIFASTEILLVSLFIDPVPLATVMAMQLSFIITG
jgi:hypothetical protein